MTTPTQAIAGNEITDAGFIPVKRQTQSPPPPGVYTEIPAEDYFDIDALSNTVLGKFCDSGRHGAHYLNQPDSESKKDQLIGQATHAAVLEPEDFAKRALACPDIGPTAEVGHRKKQEEHPDRIILRKGWLDEIRAMQRAIDSHPKARALLRDIEGRNELTLIWNISMPIGGETVEIPCKARVDRYLPAFTPHRGAEQVSGLIDLKTVRAGKSGAEQFEREIGNHGYHRQAAWYLSGAIKLGLVDRFHDYSYIIIALEKAGHHPVATYPISSATLHKGWSECVEGTKRYLKYRLHGHAPHASESLVPLNIPDWMMKSENEIDTEETP